MNQDSIANLVAAKFFGQKRPGDVPYILARRNVAPNLTYKLHDYHFEGLKKVTKNGVPGFEIDNNFVLTINEDGTCLIPDTKNNRARLEFLSKPIKTKAMKKHLDRVTGTQTEEEVEIIEPPTYQRVDENILEASLVEKIAAQVRAQMEAAAENPEDEDGTLEITKVKSPRGRPKKVSTLGGEGDHE